MESLNQALMALSSPAGVEVEFNFEIDESVVELVCKSASAHDQVKIQHLVHQIFLKATKLFFVAPDSNEITKDAKIHDELYNFSLTWIRIASCSFAGTPIAVMNMFFNDVFRFDKVIDTEFERHNQQTLKLFIHEQSSVLVHSDIYPRSNSLLWCLLMTSFPPYTHLRGKTLEVVMAILQTRNFSVWVQQTLFKRSHQRVDKDNKLVQILSRLLKISKIIFCQSKETTVCKEHSIFVSSLLQIFAESPILSALAPQLYQISLSVLQTFLYFIFESDSSVTIPAASAAASSSSASSAYKLSVRATSSIHFLQHAIGNQHFTPMLTHLLQMMYDCTSCEAFYVERSTKQANGKLLVLSVLLGMMKNKDERNQLISFLKLIIRKFSAIYIPEFTWISTFLSRLVQESQENMRVFAGDWIGYLWEAYPSPSSSSSSSLLLVDPSIQILSDSQLQFLGEKIYGLLQDDSHLVRASAASAIHYFPKQKVDLIPWENWMQRLVLLAKEDKTGKVRGAAYGAIGDLTRAPIVPYQADFLSLFYQGCQDTNLIVRMDAFWALSKWLPLRWIPANIEAFNVGKASSFMTIPQVIQQFYKQPVTRELLSLYQHAIVHDSDKILASLLLGYVSFALVHTSIVSSDLLTETMQEQMILSQIRYEMDTRLQRLLKSTSTTLSTIWLQPALWDDESQPLKHYKDITNIFALVLCLDAVSDVRHCLHRQQALPHSAVPTKEDATTVDMHLWNRIFALLASKRISLQLQATQWLLGCLFCDQSHSQTASSSSGSSSNRGIDLIVQPIIDYSPDLYLRLLETIIAMFFKTSQRIKPSSHSLVPSQAAAVAAASSLNSTPMPTTSASLANNNCYNNANNFSRIMVLKRISLLWIARMVHTVCKPSAASAVAADSHIVDSVRQIVRFNLEKLVISMETLFVSTAIVPWSTLFTFHPLFQQLGLMNGLQKDIGDNISDKKIAEYAAMVFHFACGLPLPPQYSAPTSSSSSSSSPAIHASIASQGLNPSLYLRLQSLLAYEPTGSADLAVSSGLSQTSRFSTAASASTSTSSASAAAEKVPSYSSFDGLDVIHDLSVGVASSATSASAVTSTVSPSHTAGSSSSSAAIAVGAASSLLSSSSTPSKDAAVATPSGTPAHPHREEDDDPDEI